MKMNYLLTLLLMSFGLSVSAQSYLALGDSYTIGEGVLETERWPIQLQKALVGSDLEVESTTIIAKTGWTTAELMEGIKNTNNTDQYNLVSLLIGVNNQYRGQSLDRFEKELVELIQTAITYSKQGADRVFLVSIPDWGVTPFAQDRNSDQISKEIDAFNAVLSKQARMFKIPLINITPISKEAKTDPSLLASDGLHPSGKMYGLWADQIKNELLNYF